MLNRDFASVTARIAAANKPEFAIANTPDLGMDFALATKAYNDEQKKQALISAIKAGDEEAMTAAAADLNPTGTYNYLQNIKQARADADLAFERQKELARLNNAAALERAKLTYGNNQGLGKGEFGSLMQFRNSDAFNSLPLEQQELLDARLAYLSNNPEFGYEQSYQKKKGSKQAESEFEKTANAYAAGQRARNIQDVMSEIEGMDKIMFTKAGELQSRLGQIGDVFNANWGMAEEQREKRSGIDTAIRDIGQDLIARAKSKGQAGINTVAEIERIIGNLSMTSGKAELIGALQRLMNQEQKLNALDTVATTVPTAPANNSTQTVGGFKVRVIGG